MECFKIKRPIKSKLIQVKEISKKFSSSTTVYGLTRVLKAESSFMKLLWTLMTVASASAGFGVIYETVQDYNKNDVFTHTKRLHTGSSILPAVTFCAEDTDLSKIFHTAAFHTSNGSINLTADIFVPVLKLEYTSCVKFNNHNESPPNQPFFSVLDTNTDMFIFEIDHAIDFTYLDVFFSDNSLNTIDWTEFTANIKQMKSNIIYFDLDKRVETRLGEPYNDCKDNILDVTYHQRDCLVQCSNKYAVKHYNCTPINYYKVDGFEACHQEVELDEAYCGEECPKECTVIRYDTVVSSYELPGRLQTIQIAYRDLSFIEISQTPKMNGYSLISEIGGALGLFVGITFLSFLEFLEYLSEIFFVFY